TPAAGLALRRVGHLRQQPQSQVLLHHQTRPETALDGRLLLATPHRRRRPRPCYGKRRRKLMTLPLRQLDFLLLRPRPLMLEVGFLQFGAGCSLLRRSSAVLEGAPPLVCKRGFLRSDATGSLDSVSETTQ